MRSRRPWARAAAAILAGSVMLSACRADGRSADGLPPPQRARVESTAAAAQQLLDEWLGPVAIQAPADGIAVRWLAPKRDQSLERSVIAGITRQHWAGRHDISTPFEQALVVYTALRAIHHLLEGSNFEVVRFFGGMVPWPLRSILLSPPVADPRPRVSQFDELPETPEVRRIVRGLQTIERYVGWPAMAQAMRALSESRAADLEANAFAAVLSDVRGTDITPLVHECLRPDVVFDYAIGQVRVVPAGEAEYESSVLVMRTGSGIFAVGGPDDPEHTLPVLIRFTDGTELREWLDGAAPSTTLVYTAKSVVDYAAIDPELMLLLDVNRANNTFDAAPAVRPLGLRLAMHWMAWLQQTMLSYSALV